MLETAFCEGYSGCIRKETGMEGDNCGNPGRRPRGPSPRPAVQVPRPRPTVLVPVGVPSPQPAFLSLPGVPLRCPTVLGPLGSPVPDSRSQPLSGSSPLTLPSRSLRGPRLSPGRPGPFRDTEDASETDLAKHDEDYVEMKEQMYQDKLASLKRQLQQLQEGWCVIDSVSKYFLNVKHEVCFTSLWEQLKIYCTLQEYQKRMKKLDQQYKERIRNAELFLQLETEQVERNYIKEKKAAVKEFEDKKVELKENLIAELEEKKKMIENEKLTMELTGASPSSPEHLPATPAESPAQRLEARIEDGKLYYDKRWYHKSQAIYLESKDNQKLSCVISSVGANEIWVRKTSDSTKMRIYLGQLQRGLFVIRRRSAA
ncbi:Sin3 histone deacetylase corepressor complex component SDS3 [Fukomys damarensis]|uniref:Sin3 histone deacetylase corepressor complex component SDS3 n=1 Tax=Fukomys damarensis TaxID=885580 RepID=A0A091DLW9_FUKDA|nr:Sin3 histone deacetylase corepressor complex component SDS3 [Fukomys damarensis]